MLLQVLREIATSQSALASQSYCKSAEKQSTKRSSTKITMMPQQKLPQKCTKAAAKAHQNCAEHPLQTLQILMNTLS